MKFRLDPTAPMGVSFASEPTQTIIQRGAVAGQNGRVESVVAGTNVTVDSTDPKNPIVSATGGGSGGGATNLSTASDATTVTVASDTGTDATLTASTSLAAGIMTAADRTKLDGVATGATANSADATLLDRTNHTGTQDADTITGLATVATTGAYSDLSGTPDLSALNDVVTEANLAAFPATGDSDHVYIAEDTGYMYRWNGTGYTQLTDQTAIWGQVSGTLSNQADLQAALDGKLTASNGDLTVEMTSPSSGYGSGLTLIDSSAGTAYLQTTHSLEIYANGGIDGAGDWNTFAGLYPDHILLYHQGDAGDSYVEIRNSSTDPLHGVSIKTSSSGSGKAILRADDIASPTVFDFPTTGGTIATEAHVASEVATGMAGAGDVYGTSLSVPYGLAVFSDETGKNIQQGALDVAAKPLLYPSGNFVIPGGISLNTMLEYTTDAGITAEGVLLKDGLVDGRDVSADGTALDGKLDSVVAGTNVTIDNTDPNNPIISASGGGGGGSGDVIGPASSTDNSVAVFSGTDGKTIKQVNATITTYGASNEFSDMTVNGNITTSDGDIHTPNSVTGSSLISSGYVETDTITEHSIDAGVTIDGVLIKDGGLHLDNADTGTGVRLQTNSAPGSYTATFPTATGDVVISSATQTLSNKTLTAPKIAQIDEAIAGGGVTIDGVLVKDGLVDGKDVSALADAAHTHPTTDLTATGGTSTSFLRKDNTWATPTNTTYTEITTAEVDAGTASTLRTMSGRRAGYILGKAYDRANHTGTQIASTISDFSTAADARITAATGVSVQAYDADLTAWAGKTAPTGTAVGTTDTQTLTNKTISGASNTISDVGPSARTGGFYVGTIAAATLGSTGNKAITGVGFMPKMVKFHVNVGSSGTSLESVYGVMAPSGQFTSFNYGAGGTTLRYSSASHCASWGITTTPTLLCSYVSMDADGFTINVNTASSTFPVVFEAYG